MNPILVDDAHPFVYSHGTWVQEMDSNLYNNTRSFTSEEGAMKVVRFHGTSITVWGWLQEIGRTENADHVTQYSIDDGEPKIYSPPSPLSYTQEKYYESSTLPIGEHVLTITNVVSRDIVHLDYYSIGSTDGKLPQILPSNGFPRPITRFPLDHAIKSSSSLNTLTSTASSQTTNHATQPTHTTQDTTTWAESSTQSPSPSSSSVSTWTSTMSTANSNIKPNASHTPTDSGVPDQTVAPTQEHPKSRISGKVVIGVSIVGVVVIVSLLWGAVAGLLVWKRRRQSRKLRTIRATPYTLL